MALTPTHIAAADLVDNVDRTSYTTPAFTPVANRLYKVTVINSKGTTPDVPTMSTTTGLTLVQTGTVATGNQRCTKYRAMKASGLSNGTITAGFGGVTQTSCIIIVDEYDGAVTTGTDGADAVGTAVTGSASSGSTSATVTLAAFADADSHAHFSLGINSNEAITEDGTQLFDNGHASPTRRGFTSTKANDTTPAASWTSSGGYVAVGNEVKASSAAAAYELDCQPGSYTVTGAAASLVAGRSVNAAAGSYTVTGSAASPVAGRTVNAVAGSYALTGTAAGLVADRAVNAAPGAYAVTGAAAGLLADRAVNAATGAYTATGADAGAVVGRVVSAVPGGYLVTGTDSDLVFEAPGAFELAANPGGYTVAGNATNLLAARLFNAESGAYTINGSAAGLVAAGAVLTPNLDPVLTGWIAPTVPPSIGGGTRGQIASPTSGSIG